MFGSKRIEKVKPGTVSDRFFMGQLTLVDVRTNREYGQVRVPGVMHIPLTELKGRLDEIPPDHPVAFLCRSGHRSSIAAHMAARHRDDVMNVEGGMSAWLSADLPAARCPMPDEHGTSNHGHGHRA